MLLLSDGGKRIFPVLKKIRQEDMILYKTLFQTCFFHMILSPSLCRTSRSILKESFSSLFVTASTLFVTASALLESLKALGKPHSTLLAPRKTLGEPHSTLLEARKALKEPSSSLLATKWQFGAFEVSNYSGSCCRKFKQSRISARLSPF
jgi:hypothetical protein